jgi:hypothetical protein
LKETELNTTEFAKKIFGRSNIKGVEAIHYNYEWKYKIVVFVPVEKADEITFSMALAGAGKIGNYSLCSFRTKGVGTFMGGNTSDPFIGKKGKFEMVEELRLEMISDDKYLNGVIDSMYNIHPYEEPAYEIYPVMLRKKKADDKIIAVSFKKPLLLNNVLNKLNSSIDIPLINKIKPGVKILSAVVDFAPEEPSEPRKKGSSKVLYIKKISKSTYNIRLV